MSSGQWSFTQRYGRIIDEDEDEDENLPPPMPNDITPEIVDKNGIITWYELQENNFNIDGSPKASVLAIKYYKLPFSFDMTPPVL